MGEKPHEYAESQFQGFRPREKPDTLEFPHPARQEPVILIVDDNAQSAMTLWRIVRQRGHQVEYVHSGEAAIDFCRKCCAPSLLILDQSMPGLTGAQTLALLRELPGCAATPAIFYSASALVPELRNEIDRLGARVWLTKSREGHAELMEQIQSITGAS